MVMKEELLHHIWKMKRFESTDLSLVDGRRISLLSVGIHNHTSGPDFFNASILIDGIRWIGNVEIHINSSDWYKHKHQNDEAYDTVILHVVYCFDQAVFIKNESIPTLELKPYIELDFLDSYKKISRSRLFIPCSDQLKNVPSIVIYSQLDAVFMDRMEDKSLFLNERYAHHNKDLKQLLYEQVLRFFGLKNNELPFIELSSRIPYQIIKQIPTDSWEAVLLGAAGLLEIKSDDLYLSRMKKEWFFYKCKYDLISMNATSWKCFGSRPAAYPPFRIAQCARLLSSFELTEILHNLTNWDLKSSVSLSSFWQTHYQLHKKSKPHTTQFTTKMLHLFLINVVIPVQWWFSNYSNYTISKSALIEFSENIPFESNHIVSAWQNHSFKIKSAKESQGILQQFHSFCEKKRCLTCKIGSNLMNSELNK